jgi:hypothetical protein
MIAELQAKLAEKQSELTDDSGGGEKLDARAEQQIEEYGRRGINLVAYYETENTLPDFINIEEDAFRSHRFMYACLAQASHSVWQQG